MVFIETGEQASCVIATTGQHNITSKVTAASRARQSSISFQNGQESQQVSE
jgi:hypothetical protein